MKRKKSDHSDCETDKRHELGLLFWRRLWDDLHRYPEPECPSYATMARRFAFSEVEE